MLKGLLVGTGIGQTALAMREHAALHKAAITDLENVGMIANDLMARNLLERLCKEGSIFVDVGAHIGSVIAGAMCHSRPSRIIAVEAIPEKAAALRKRFPTADIIETAVSDHDGEVDFTIDLTQSGFSSLNPDLALSATAFRVIRVRMTTLDAIAPHENIDLIKIDVEGAELGVLRGAEMLIKRSRPIIMFESGATEMAGFPHMDLWQWFSDHDYEVALPVRLAHTGTSLTLDAFMTAHDYPRLTTNYFGVPRERRDEVRLAARKILGFA